MATKQFVRHHHTEVLCDPTCVYNIYWHGKYLGVIFRLEEGIGVIYTKALSVRMGSSKEGSFVDASITEFINQCSNSSGLIDDYAMHRCILASLVISYR